MSEKPIAIVNPVTHTCLGHHRVEILELLHVRVVSERIAIGEVLAVLTDAASGEIESDCAKAPLGQLLREVRKE